MILKSTLTKVVFFTVFVKHDTRSNPYFVEIKNPKCILPNPNLSQTVTAAHTPHALFLTQEMESIGDCRMIDISALRQMKHTPPLL